MFGWIPTTDKLFDFQDAANSALQETIGDTIMLSVASPNHLERLGLMKNVSAGKIKITYMYIY